MGAQPRLSVRQTNDPPFGTGCSLSGNELDDVGRRDISGLFADELEEQLQVGSRRQDGVGSAPRSDELQVPVELWMAE